YRSVAGDSRISHLGPQDFIYGLSFNCFRPLFFPINWLTVERFNFYFVKYLLFIYSFILLSIIVFNSPKITRSKPVNIALVYIFITGLMIAGMWEIGRSLSGARFYYLVSFGFYLFIVSLAAPAESGNLIKKRLVFTVLTLLVVFNCIFLKINSFSWEKAGKLSYKILKQTGEIYPELNKIKDSTIFYWKITSQYDGALCMGERIQYALPLFYGKDSPRAAYSGQILNMHNLKEVGLGKKAFYAKWDENKESLSDITPSLISALSQYKNDLKIIRDASKAITEVSSWSNNSHLQKEENSCKIKVLGTSGWLESEVFYLPARACADLILTMKVVPASAKYYSGLYAGRLYWLTDKKNEFSDDRFIEFWIKPNNDYNVYTLIFIGPEEVLNDEIITKFRLMPVLFPAEIEIKDMRLEAKY
ncbi:MAG: hypothetical protein KJ880_06465, partial [Candidatus Omnitrophica bacterium]|nr:hypothetical protein [Candidatus Omnitrophota bacterium]